MQSWSDVGLGVRVKWHQTRCPCVDYAVYQSLIRTCSREVTLDSVSDMTTEPAESDFSRQKITYRDYIGLWTTLLHLSTVKVAPVDVDAVCETSWHCLNSWPVYVCIELVSQWRWFLASHRVACVLHSSSVLPSVNSVEGRRCMNQ